MLLALSVIVSLFGMVNTLALSVYERTRELGMLRAVGTTRRQARRMIRHEGVITALIGAALGIPLGLFLALLVTKALSQFDVRYADPVRDADRVRRHCGRRRARRGAAAGAARGAAQRARGAPVRVSSSRRSAYAGAVGSSSWRTKHQVSSCALRIASAHGASVSSS